MNGLDFSTFASQGATEDVSDLDDQPSSESESEGEMIIEGKKNDKKEVEEIVKKEKKENEVKKAREGETLAGLVEGATEGAKAGKVKKGDYVSSLARTLRFALGCSHGAEIVFALYSFRRVFRSSLPYLSGTCKTFPPYPRPTSSPPSPQPFSPPSRPNPPTSSPPCPKPNRPLPLPQRTSPSCPRSFGQERTRTSCPRSFCSFRPIRSGTSEGWKG